MVPRSQITRRDLIPRPKMNADHLRHMEMDGQNNYQPGFSGDPCSPGHWPNLLLWVFLSHFYPKLADNLAILLGRRIIYFLLVIPKAVGFEVMAARQLDLVSQLARMSNTHRQTSRLLTLCRAGA